jgi:hypothetical protein
MTTLKKSLKNKKRFSKRKNSRKSKKRFSKRKNSGKSKKNNQQRGGSDTYNGLWGPYYTGDLVYHGKKGQYTYDLPENEMYQIQGFEVENNANGKKDIVRLALIAPDARLGWFSVDAQALNDSLLLQTRPSERDEPPKTANESRPHIKDSVIEASEINNFRPQAPPIERP